jgi:hypothetical protein
MRKQPLPPITKRGTKRKTRSERQESHEQAAAQRDYESELLRCTRVNEGRRTYGDRLADGFGMMGGD